MSEPSDKFDPGDIVSRRGEEYVVVNSDDKQRVRVVPTATAPKEIEDDRQLALVDDFFPESQLKLKHKDGWLVSMPTRQATRKIQKAATLLAAPPPSANKAVRLKVKSVVHTLSEIRDEIKGHIDFLNEIVSSDLLDEKQASEVVKQVDAAREALFYLHAIAKHYYRGR